MDDNANNHGSDPRSLIPRPDPTSLTTQQMLHEVGALKELLSERLSAMDKAITLLQTSVDLQPRPAVISEMVKSLRDLHEEKFSSISMQLAERESRFAQAAKDRVASVETALHAAKEFSEYMNQNNTTTNSKTEAAFSKQIDGINALIYATTKGMDEKISDIKDRLTTIEGRSTGRSDIWGIILGAAALVVALVTIIGFSIKTSPNNYAAPPTIVTPAR